MIQATFCCVQGWVNPWQKFCLQRLGLEMGKNEFLTPKAVRVHGTVFCHFPRHRIYISFAAAYCSVHCRLATESRPRVCRS